MLTAVQDKANLTQCEVGCAVIIVSFVTAPDEEQFTASHIAATPLSLACQCRLTPRDEAGEPEIEMTLSIINKSRIGCCEFIRSSSSRAMSIRIDCILYLLRESLVEDCLRLLPQTAWCGVGAVRRALGLRLLKHQRE